ncbi:MAG: 4-(cytidine 5'-diphospho)-2-C-methyl-D-erythritol kinase [Porticoccaceae bacterium]|nr:4-(cytidine 5'-diphospho)-2-C-methyl-D-erythritol kinase [Porticoccaceae bacterium]MBT5578565.1 4-(cytidine 5'-diphospho)-2-C-methyl-D-erythritol kinase [Porticoccaceae bacterium]
MTSISLPSPAKLNLFLHITGRRPDGYHELQTLFQLLDFGDNLTFTPNSSGNISLSPQIANLAMADNLIVRAAKLLQQHSGCASGCDILLDKQIPMGGGLGGGSSNAATVLVALNRLWQCGLSEDSLAQLGAQLGADVAVFVRGYSAFAEGIGELLTPVHIPEQWYLVITPNVQVSTAEIFSNPQLTRNSSPIKIRALSGEQYRNDCQAVVEQLYPAVKQALEWIKDYNQPLMTGTGASVFCSFDSQTEAQRAKDLVPKHWNAFIARGVNRSSLHQRLENFFTGASPSG